MKYSLPKKIIYSIIVAVLLVGLVLTAFFGLNGKGYGSTYDIDLGLDLARARLIVIHHDTRILGFEGFLDGDELLFLQGGIQHHGSARFGHGRGGGENQRPLSPYGRLLQRRHKRPHTVHACLRPTESRCGGICRYSPRGYSPPYRNERKKRP